MRLDESFPKETEGTTTTNEELVPGDRLELDTATLAFPNTVDGWLMAVVE